MFELAVLATFLLSPAPVATAAAAVPPPFAPQAEGAQAGGGPAFAEARAPLSIAFDDGQPPTLAALLERYAEAAGATLIVSDETAVELRGKRAPLGMPLELSAHEAAPVVEALLCASRLGLRTEVSGDVTLLTVLSLDGAERGGARSAAHQVPSTVAGLALVERHPAHFVTLTLSLPHVDVRQLANSTRTLVTDANLLQVLPAGNTNAMVVSGRGDQVLAHAQHMLIIEESVAAATRARTPIVEVVRLEHAEAPEVRTILATAFGFPRDGSEPAPDARGSRTMQAQVDERTNSLVLRGTPAELESLRAIVRALDVPQR